MYMTTPLVVHHFLLPPNIPRFSYKKFVNQNFEVCLSCISVPNSVIPWHLFLVELLTASIIAHTWMGDGC